MGLGRRTFAPGEVLTASNVMNYLQDQAVMNFAGTAARGSAIGTALQEGMVSYLNDTDRLEVYRAIGTAAPGWNPVAFESYVDSRSGLVPVIAPTVNYSGGTATANSLGRISFTSVTSLSLNNVFSSSYNHYRILARITYDAGRQGQFRMRNAGSDNTSSIYSSNGYYQNGTGAVSTYQAQTVVTGFIGEGTTDTSYSIDIFSPFEARLTRTVSLCSGVISGQFTNHNIGCVHNTASSFDGISIIPSAGNMTGIIQVYGYRT